MSEQRQFKWPTQQPQMSPLADQPTASYPIYQAAPSFQPAYMPSQQLRELPQPYIQTGQGPRCRHCGNELSFFDRLALDRQTHRCRTCDSQIQQALQRFRTTFLEITSKGMLSNIGWTTLQRLAAQERLDMGEALFFIRNDTQAFVERVVTQAENSSGISDEVEQYIYQLLKILSIPQELALSLLRRVTQVKRRTNIKLLERALAEAEARGDVTEEVEQQMYRLQATLGILPEEAQHIYQRLASLRQRSNLQRFHRAAAEIESNGEVTEGTQYYILQLQRELAIPNEVAQPVFQRLAYLKRLTSIRQGNLPTVATSVQLESDEVCHLETPATYYKVNAKSTKLIAGRLVATNKKLHFLSSAWGTTINWSSIMRIEVRDLPAPHGGVYLELSKVTGNGLYTVADPILVGAVLNTLVKISKRQLVSTKIGTSHHIPQNVKNAVWQRDGGKCVQCGATSYLEFDHIIPHTKGGANSVANVQLLCRSCNLKKSDHI